ncbi:hypothetical protein IWW34DRAFT_885007 [Fusarium oxysporum f. sp. albedinis]|nr:hypothetical protein IWW34DRAFT_885007 [Fusarium oxysporum f. sp. albedinis]KAK2471105.1 hypothetical protein H9L39_17336 [Fusarium oxysporum f. sp. albedinis]
MSQDIAEADALIWRAYGEMVKNFFLAGSNGLQEGLDYIYVCPPTEHGIRGGSPIPDAVTNFNISTFADSLQRADSPLFMPGAELSYFESLKVYLNAARVRDITPSQKEEIQQAIQEARNLETQRDARRNDAVARWEADTDARRNHTSFRRWAVANAQSYLQSDREAKLAAGQVRQLQSRYYGAAADTLTDKLLKLDNLAGDDLQSNPGYNMPCYIRDYKIDETALEEGRRVEGLPGDDLVYRPLYVIDGYESACDDWIRGTDRNNFVWNLNLIQSRHNDWTDLGHSTNASRRGSSFFFFFSKSSASSSTETHLNFTGADWKENTSIALTMKGPVKAFNLSAGLWDVPGVRRLFPHLLDGETDTALGLVRAHKILVGYQVAFKIKFAESLRTQVRNMLIEARSDATSGLRIFGFQFGRDTGSKTSFTRDINSLSYNESTNEISAPESPEGCPVLLGVLGRKITA